MARGTKRRKVARNPSPIKNEIEKKALAQDGAEQPLSGELSKQKERMLQERHRNFDWIDKHEDELLQKYAGKMVAVCNRQVVGWGADRKQALESTKHSKSPLEGVVLVAMLPAGAEFPPDNDS